MFGVLLYVNCILHRASSNIYLFTLRRTKQIKKAVYKTEYHSENKVQNLAQSLDVINQRLKYRFLSDCLWFNEVKFCYVFYELRYRNSVYINYLCKHNFEVYLFCSNTSGYGAKTWKVAGSISEGDIGIFHIYNPSGSTMALGSTQCLQDTVPGIFPGG
jgi:hypothetical protein